jgi:hypothetical protein
MVIPRRNILPREALTRMGQKFVFGVIVLAKLLLLAALMLIVVS